MEITAESADGPAVARLVNTMLDLHVQLMREISTLRLTKSIQFVRARKDEAEKALISAWERYAVSERHRGRAMVRSLSYDESCEAAVNLRQAWLAYHRLSNTLAELEAKTRRPVENVPVILERAVVPSQPLHSGSPLGLGLWVLAGLLAASGATGMKDVIDHRRRGESEWQDVVMPSRS